MSSIIDSNAVLVQRAVAIGISSLHATALTLSGFDTFAKFAFSCNYAPNAPDEQPLVDRVTAIIGAAPTPTELGGFRRLFFEAYTLSANDLRQRVDRVEDSQPRKLAAPDRAFRYESQVQRLRGLNLTNELEPSDALVDRACQQAEDNRLAYIEWSMCTKKAQELAGIKTIPQLKYDSSGIVRLGASEQELHADLDSELLMRFALQRRGLAYDQAGVLTFSVHEEWVDKIIFHRLSIPLPGYGKISIPQLLNADRALFTYLSSKTRGGIAPNGAGIRPLDVHLQAGINDNAVVFLLLPLPLPHSNKRPADDDKAGGAGGAKGSGKNKKQKGKGKGDSKGKGNKSGKPRNMPADMAGMHATDHEGVHLCFNFNRGSCNLPVANGRCNNGRHVCCKPNCYGPHAMGACPGH